MSSHDVRMSQSASILATVDHEQRGADLAGKQVLSELGSLAAAAQHPALAGAFHEFGEQSLDIASRSAQTRLQSAKTAGDQILAIVSEGDQEMANHGGSAQEQAEGTFTMPGTRPRP